MNELLEVLSVHGSWIGMNVKDKSPRLGANNTKKIMLGNWESIKWVAVLTWLALLVSMVNAAKV